MTWALWAIVGGLLCASGIFFAAFLILSRWAGLDPNQRMFAVLGVVNQMFHGLAVMIIGALSMRVDRIGVHVATLAMVCGTLVLSVGSYATVFRIMLKEMRYVMLTGTVLAGLGWCGFIAMLAML